MKSYYKMEKFILDTDIGTDVDDALALCYLLKENAKLEAITTVQGKTKIRAAIANTIAKAFNKEITVFAGNKTPHANEFWVGFEGKGIKLENNKKVIKNLPKLEDVTLICIGPLSNIPLLLKKLDIKRVYMMGGAIEKNGQYLPDSTAHNVKIDPVAAEELFSSDVPITIIPTGLAKQFYLTKEDFVKIRSTNNSWGDYLYNNANEWAKYSMYKIFYLYDPLTVAVALNRSIIKESKSLGNKELVTEVEKNLFSAELLVKKLLGDKNEKAD